MTKDTREEIEQSYLDVLKDITKNCDMATQTAVEKLLRSSWVRLIDSQKEEWVKTLPKKKYHVEYSWSCPKCMLYGNEGEYCPIDRRKLMEKKTKYQTEADEAYNRAIDDLINQLESKDA